MSRQKRGTTVLLLRGTHAVHQASQRGRREANFPSIPSQTSRVAGGAQKLARLAFDYNTYRR